MYGWAMSQYMPYGDFKWIEPTLSGLSDLSETSPIGRVYEVDISYPVSLHDAHSDLPFLPEISVPAGSKVRKLMATFEQKKNYIIHYRNLKQAIDNGLKVEKVNILLCIMFDICIYSFFLLGLQSSSFQPIALVGRLY